MFGGKIRGEKGTGSLIDPFIKLVSTIHSIKGSDIHIPYPVIIPYEIADRKIDCTKKSCSSWKAVA